DSCQVEGPTAEPIDVFDDHDVDPGGVDVGEQTLQRGAVEVRAAAAAIVVTIRDEGPARLLPEVTRARDPLRSLRDGVARCTCRRSRVDGAAHGLGWRRRHVGLHRTHTPVSRFPGTAAARPRKNVKPFHAVPVIRRAICDSERWRCPWYSNP